MSEGGREGETGVSESVFLSLQVRRDNCRLVAKLIDTCLHKLLLDR